MSTFTNEDARALQAAINPIAATHTDILLRVARSDGSTGLASAIHVHWEGRDLLVSCHHALRPNHSYFGCAQRLERDMIDEGSLTTPPN